MTRLKRTGTLAMAALFLGVILYYSFCQSFIPGAVCKAFPPDVRSSVYRADSLEELLQSPVCSQLDKALGAGNSLRALLDSGNWTALAAPSEIAVAGIPCRHPGQSQAWAAASWVGWRSPWLRWKLDQVDDRTLTPIKSPFIWPVWKLNNPEIARDQNLYFALTDNLFLACLSNRPEDIYLLLYTYDKRNPEATL